MTVSLPGAATGQVSLSKNGVSIGMGIPYGAGAGNGQNIGNATTVYLGGAPNVAIAAQADTSGAREAVTITGPSAPTTYDFPLTLPEGASLIPDSNGDGGYSIQSTASNGVTDQYGTIAAPWAKDANGNSVPTTYAVEGSTLIQTVEFTSSTAFPVVADPEITLGVYVYFYISGSDINTFENTLGHNVQALAWTVISAALCAPFVGGYAFVCSLLGAVFGNTVNNLLITAYSRQRGGIVFEFTYIGTFVGYQYVGSWS